MKALKGYPPSPQKLVVYWPILGEKGELNGVHVFEREWGHGSFKSFNEILLKGDGSPETLLGKDAWWFSPECGHVGNVYALRQLLGGYNVSRGIHGHGRGLWSLDFYALSSELPILCLRDPSPITGESEEFIRCDAADAPHRCAMLSERLHKARAILESQDTPMSLTLSSSAACWVRHELIPGGRGHYARIQQDGARAQFNAEQRGEIPKVSVDWMSNATQPAPRRKHKRWPDDAPDMDAWEWEPRTDAHAAPAYYGGRVEKWSDDLTRGYLFDIRSAYAEAMTYPLPTRFRRFGGGEPPDEGFVIAEARVFVPSNCLVPPLPYRLKGGQYEGQVFYPTGAWDGTYTLEELRAAAQCGAQYEVKKWWLWDCDWWLAPYVAKWWKAKSDAELSGDKHAAIVAKRMLTNLYGKFGQDDGFETLTTDAGSFERAIQNGRNPGRIMVPVEGQKDRVALYRIPDTRAAPLRHTAVAACIAARVRAALALECDSVLRRGGRIGGVATDSIATDVPVACGTELGDFKLEKSFDRGEWLTDRCLAYLSEGAWDVRAAGLPLSRRDGEGAMDYTHRVNRTWESLRESGSVATMVPRGLRRGVEIGDIRFVLEPSRYAPRDGIGLPKRRAGLFGTTLAWNHGELCKSAGSPR